MPLLMLRRTWPGNFRRSVRDAKGQIVRTVEFQKEEPQEISEAEMEFFQNDLGKALVLVKLDDAGLPRPIDWVPPAERKEPKKAPEKSEKKKEPKKAPEQG